MRFKTKNGVLVDNLRFELNRMNFKYSKEKAINNDLSGKLVKWINKSKENEMLLKRVLNELTEHNTKIKELEKENEELKKEIEVKESQRRKAVGKEISLSRQLNKLKEQKEGEDGILNSFIKENRHLKGLVKSNKDARIYLKGKSEHE